MECIKKYNFRETDFPNQDVIESLEKIRGQEGFLSNKAMVDSIRKAVDTHNIPEKYFQALETFDRALFTGDVPGKYDFKGTVFADGQTVPASNILFTNLLNLDLSNGQENLEIEAGSGYYTCLLADLANNSAVYSTEIRPRILEIAERNVKKLGMGDKVKIIPASKDLGYEKMSPYNRITTTVAARNEKHLAQLLGQLKETDGLLMLPVVCSKHGSDTVPWNPNDKIGKDVVDHDPSKGFVKVNYVIFESNGKNGITYAVDKRILGGPYFR
ncbi:MAG: hypothetical protein KAS32_03615 [Candidatus Peribacteraceae bacterium]|nr:hypothetical protein [Candidatus Peribacteraceae bacterium]